MSRSGVEGSKADPHCLKEPLNRLTIGGQTSPSSAISGTPSSPRNEFFANLSAPPTATINATPPAVVAVTAASPAAAPTTTCTTFSSMKYRNLGKAGVKVPLVGLAVWTAFGTRLADQTAEEIISMAYDHGVNYFDTGDAFANGRCEVVLGNVLRKRNWKRSSFLVSSKLFWTTGPSASSVSPSLSRKFIVEAIESSLKRLQLSYIDIVMINKLDGMCPMEEIVRAMQHLLDRGLVHYWGTSRWSPVHIMEAFTVARQFNLTPPSVEQMEYHMFCRDKMELYMPELYHKLGVGVISWSPHSLSNDDGIQLISRRAISNEEKSFRSAKQLELNTLAVRLGCDSVQLAIAWSLRNDQTNCVLIAPRSTDQLFLHLNSLKVLAKMNPAIMDDVEVILNNKPAVKKRGQSVSERSAILAAAAAASSTGGGGAPESSSFSGPAAAAAGTAGSNTAIPSGPVQV